jgi:succinoglycan biosynthesis protein ExoA
MITSANLICRKKVLEKVKFDPKLFPGEDPKFISDAKKAGFRVAYNPDLIIYHRRRPDVKSLFKQIFNYGKVRPLKEKFSETLKMPFFLIPSLFLLYLAIVLVTLLVLITKKMIGFQNLNLGIYFWIFLPLFLYIFLALCFALYDSTKNKDYKAILFLPFIYPIIHVSYGAGMIYGYLKKILKK